MSDVGMRRIDSCRLSSDSAVSSITFYSVSVSQVSLVGGVAPQLGLSRSANQAWGTRASVITSKQAPPLVTRRSKLIEEGNEWSLYDAKDL